MTDLIERRKAAEILCKSICGNDRGLCVSKPENCWQSKMVELYKLETVDAVPVVRCKNCIHYDMGVCLKVYSDVNVSSDAWQKRNPDDFCSYGESVEKDG